MNKEEKEAIEYFKSNLEMTKEMGKRWGFEEEIKNNEIVLNLIQKQEEIIDKMAEHLADIIKNDDNASLLPFYDYQENLKEEVKEYFKKEVEKDVEDKRAE